MGKVANCSQPKSKRADEYLIQNWYDGNWNGILRYTGEKQAEVREAIAQVATLAANNNHIGYSQSSRLSYFKQLKKHNWAPDKIDKNCEADCSSSTAANVIAAGHHAGVKKLQKVSEGLTSSDTASALQKVGFKYYTGKKYTSSDKNLLRGDILVCTSRHVTIYIGSGKSSGKTVDLTAPSDSVPKDFKQGDPKYSNHTKGGARMGANGCGPTSVADVVAACDKLNPKGDINHVTVFDWMVSKGYLTSSGSGYAGINAALKHYGVKSSHITKFRGDSFVGHGNYLSDKSSDKLINLIKKPHMWAICLTDLYGGHFVVAYTATNSKVKIKDPGSSQGTYDNMSHKSFKNTVRSAWVIDVSSYSPNGNVSAISSGGGSGNYVDDGGNINLQQAIARLYTSDNYKWVVDGDKKEPTKFQKYFKQSLLDTIRNIQDEKNNKTPPSDTALSKAIEQVTIATRKVMLDAFQITDRQLVRASLSSYPNLVEAPYIEIDLNGITIGGYNHQEDKFPNHVNSLEIDKINGRINQYTISLSHQVRAGEDPNFIDSLLSRTGVRNKIKIKYGDSAYGAFFREDEAYIIDATYNEDVVSAKINYTLKAVSSVGAIQQAYFNFPGIESKPSTEIIKMLYTNKTTSKPLLDLLGGMQNKLTVLNKGYIPTDDATMYIPGGSNMSLTERLQQLVSYMHDPNDPTSSYFLTFQDDAQNNGLFKITKVKKTGKGLTMPKNCYYLDVGYPGDSYVTNFSLDNDVYWPMYFEYAGSFERYNYDIDYSGNLIKTKINPLTIDSKYQSIDTKRMNWWNFVNSYPVSASVTIKGLMKPIVLMENVYVYAQFYGKEDLASGLYSITGQHDSISGGGCTTTLQLLRVQN